MTELEKKALEYSEGMAMYYESTHEGYVPSQFEKYLRKAYLAGAKENGVVWHNLRKNPQDLPSRKGFETYSERLITDKGYGVYNFRKYRWYVDDSDCDCMVHTEVIAWCEIPEFKEV